MPRFHETAARNSPDMAAHEDQNPHAEDLFRLERSLMHETASQGIVSSQHRVPA
jgi:hypothetical protein